ncbi:glycosyltransferase [Occallatibacter savannae]|uniref:glycosyltransferase n=1 Tax=Occallatibacter savannae TaxID=1002691 RepID=UPI001EF63E74|nr:glycosyltransferase [Occallatibacter savannae]
MLGTADFAGKAVNEIVEYLATSLDPTRYQIEACYLRCGEFNDRFRTIGIKSRCVEWNGAPSNPIGAARFAAVLLSGKYDLIHLHTGGRYLTKLCRLFSNAKIVRHVHGRASEETGEISLVLNLPESDVTVANSRTVAQACGSRHVTVIYPGVDVNEFSPDKIRRRTLTVGTACRLEPVKDVATLIDAVSIVAAQHPAIRLEIAGEGSLRTALQERVHALGISENVAFLGWRSDVSALHHSWSLFIQPSLDEGFGVSVLEAMASGLPVIASDAGGLRELIVDGKTGLLVPPGNPTILAEKIRLLIESPDVMATMGDAGRLRAQESFSLQQMMRETVDLYDRLFELV